METRISEEQHGEDRFEAGRKAARDRAAGMGAEEISEALRRAEAVAGRNRDAGRLTAAMDYEGRAEGFRRALNNHEEETVTEQEQPKQETQIQRVAAKVPEAAVLLDRQGIDPNKATADHALNALMGDYEPNKTEARKFVTAWNKAKGSFELPAPEMPSKGKTASGNAEKKHRGSSKAASTRRKKKQAEVPEGFALVPAAEITEGAVILNAGGKGAPEGDAVEERVASVTEKDDGYNKLVLIPAGVDPGDAEAVEAASTRIKFASRKKSFAVKRPPAPIADSPTSISHLP